jgi:hypothetical protein
MDIEHLHAQLPHYGTTYRKSSDEVGNNLAEFKRLLKTKLYEDAFL